jgi:hypothetical protein
MKRVCVYVRAHACVYAVSTVHQAVPAIYSDKKVQGVEVGVKVLNTAFFARVTL